MLIIHHFFNLPFSIESLKLSIIGGHGRVSHQDRPHSDEAFADYLRWYLPRTRTRVVHVPPEAQIEAARVSETYPVVRDQNFAIAVRFSD